MNMLKNRYWVIGYDDYYPGGFDEDIIDTFNILKEAKLYLKNQVTGYDNTYIFDADKREFIE